jgi:pyroglutamyl-peptidase
LVIEHRPAFVLALGLALGAPIIRIEKVAINAVHFAIADGEGARPRGGQAFAPNEPPARFATWDADAVVEEILQAGIPATTSYHAGTHLCNLTLFTLLSALESVGLRSPCGFLHLPYLPEHIVWMMRQRAGVKEEAPVAPLELPSMTLDAQRVAVIGAVRALMRQATARKESGAED